MSKRLSVAGLLALLFTIGQGSANATPIFGSLTDPTGHEVDTYLIHITNPALFSASTANAGTTTALDAMLFLFAASGSPVEANDDTCNGSCTWDPRPTLPAGNPFSPISPGLYYLAITSFENLPVNASNTELFFPRPEGEGTRGPVALGPVDHYTLVGGYSGLINTGDYRIDLTGAEPVPEPASLLLLGSGLVGLAARRRARRG